MNQQNNQPKQNLVKAAHIKKQGFSKSQRLLSPAQFKAVFDKTEKKIHQSHLMMLCKKNELNHARLGLAITKKKVPTAVARNELKRLTREQFRLNANNLANVDVVLIAKRPIKELSKQELTEQVTALFKKLQSLKVNHK